MDRAITPIKTARTKPLVRRRGIMTIHALNLGPHSSLIRKCVISKFRNIASWTRKPKIMQEQTVGDCAVTYIYIYGSQGVQGGLT